jgi:hypothetical protein
LGSVCCQLDSICKCLELTANSRSARATSAAPFYFPAFGKRIQGGGWKEYIGGGALHNNPVEIAIEETQAISNATAQSPNFDIVLSLGCGLGQGPPPLQRSAVAFLKKQAEINTNAEKRFVTIKAAQEPTSRERLRRLNPALQGMLPRVDDVDSMGSLTQRTLDALATPAWQDRLLETACILAASSFYFERSGRPYRDTEGWLVLPGRIRCRFDDYSQELRMLGRFLRGRSSRIVFRVRENDLDNPSQELALAANITELPGRFHVPGFFSVRQCNPDKESMIELYLPELTQNVATKYPISGFPRPLLQYDFRDDRIEG